MFETIISLFFPKKETQEEALERMIQEEKIDYKNKLLLIRSSHLPEAEKKVQRSYAREQHAHNMSLLQGNE